MQDTLEALREANNRRAVEWMDGGKNKNYTLEDLDFQPDAFNGEMLFRSNELGGECGEVQGAIKRLSRTLNGWRGGWTKEKAIANLRQELADVVICADRLAELFGIDLRAEVPAKFNETSEKNGLQTRMEIPRFGCAACDRGDFQLGHAEGCPSA